ncbi:MAG: hypothetical protein IJA10_12545 [Lachnospiraceae bacterium]|nr:hypothetical protein [Lachnospiraceae bacterium]
MLDKKVVIEYDGELKEMFVSANGNGIRMSIRDLEPMDKLLKLLNIPYETSIGEMMGDTDYLKFQYDNDFLYKLGVEAGVKQMMDKIQKHCELGKPVMANGELYFFKDARQNLIDIMDDIEADWKAKQGIKKFIVPIKMLHTKGEIVREVIIETNKAEAAMLIAIGDFQHNGWIVDTDFRKYKQLE